MLLAFHCLPNSIHLLTGLPDTRMGFDQANRRAEYSIDHLSTDRYHDKEASQFTVSIFRLGYLDHPKAFY